MTPGGVGATLAPLSVLARGVASYAAHLDAEGELRDPVFDQPTQYATPYHALANAVLATKSDGAERALYVERAWRGMRASLRLLLGPDRPPPASSFDRATGAVTAINHRDFFWPPVLGALDALQEVGADTASLAASIRAVDVPGAFRARPPSNWSAVWLAGEWRRIVRGLSPTTPAQFDAWLAPFFDGWVLPDLGLYQEPGHPNSYDLFTRYHLALLLADGYVGGWRERLWELLGTGLRRSLAVQLSDGSLASAHRSTGQTWTVAAECAYLGLASRLLAGEDPELSGRAAGAAWLALSSLRRWQRPDGPFSPVENCLPPSWRVGYEGYTADGHYGNLALGFLAAAVRDGFPGAGDGAESACCRVEGDPTHRAIAHAGPYTVHANASPAPAYDAFGVVDLTFGPDRLLQLVSSVRHMASGRLFNVGLATRSGPGLGALDVAAQADMALAGPIRELDRSGFEILARPRGRAQLHRLRAGVSEDGVVIEEGTPGHRAHRTLLVPYPRDMGLGSITEVVAVPGGVHFRHGDEVVALEVDAPVEQMVDLPHGYESRRGLCGLLRLDLEGQPETVTVRWRVIR